MKKLLCTILAVAMIVSAMGITAFAENVDGATENTEVTADNAVAMVGTTYYATIDDAIAKWTNGTTLTLLSDVTLSSVIKLSSTEMHTLDLGAYTMTAASKQHAIQIIPNGRSKAGSALDIKADATNPGGITATDKACIYSQGKSNLKDRPIIKIYGGIFNGTYAIYHFGSSGTNCPQFSIYGGEFNGIISTNRTLNQFSGGTFNEAFMLSVDSSAYTRIDGGKYKNPKNNFMSALDANKWTFGTSKGIFDVNIYVDDQEYYVVTKSEIDPAIIGADVAVDYSSVGNSSPDAVFKFSKLNVDKKLSYTSADLAIKNYKKGTITLYTDTDTNAKASGALTIDCSLGATYSGNVTLETASSTFEIILPEDGEYNGTVTQCNSSNYLIINEKVEDGKKTITYTQTTNPAATGDEASLSSGGVNTMYKKFDEALVDAVDGDTITLYKDVTYNINTTEAVSLMAAGEPIIIDLNKNTLSPEDPTIPTFETSKKYILKNGTITGDVVNNGGDLVFEDVTVEGNLTINAGTADIISGYFTGKVITTDETAVDIVGGTFVEDPAAYVSDGYDVIRYHDKYVVTKLSEEAQTVFVTFEKTDVENNEDNLEDKDTYNIVLKANVGDKINGLASADLTFKFDDTPVTDGDMNYTITPAAGMSLTQLGNRYMFNYDGVAKYEEDGDTIIIGTITIDGYGTYTFSAIEADTNVVNATTMNDNLVDYYVKDGDIDASAATGGLVVSEVTATIAVPTRTLTIDIDFPNMIHENVKAYQNMSVSIVGGNIDKTIDLGSDAVDTDNLYTATVEKSNVTTDAHYTIKVNLPYNTTYTVTVEGAGYRTARHSVTLTEAKTLKFWNNVMTKAEAIEAGKPEVHTNFLAGDIVKDNKINVYDLSAVVSYFGTEGLSAANHPEYAKYDLNRDGLIDSRDVAYILVSWNN